jgi:hypothetical protein
LLVGVEVAGAKRFAEFIDMRGQALDNRFRAGRIGMHGCAGFVREARHEFPHLFEAFLAGLIHEGSFLRVAL